jgi:Ca2+-binding EF-hand superfamily protein
MSKRSSQSKLRTARWAGYSKDHETLTFENIPAKFQPSMFENRHGLALYLEKIDGWRLPKSVYGQLGEGKFHLSLQLSLSLFHLTSGTFFGTTWMGPRISLSNPEKAYTKDVELQFKEMIYLVSRINDETCVGVVEIVVGKENEDVNLTAGQYGCGWTMLNIFSKNLPPDCSDRREDVQLMSCPIFAGSPRELVMNPNIDKLAKSLKEIPDCYIFFKVYSHRRLLKVQRHVAENEVIGRYDPIPGLVYRDVVPPDRTRSVLLPCIGDEEVAQRDGIRIFPAKPKMVMYSMLKIADCQLYLPRRDAVEVRIIESVLSGFPKDKSKEVKVLQRYFKYGLHNGHSIIGELQSQPLMEDQEDRDILLTQDPVLTLYGYAPDECLALVCSVEYQIGIPAPKIERADPKELIRTSQQLDVRPLMSVSVALGCAAYIPSDGFRLQLKNVKPAPAGSTEEGLNIELPLERNEICKYVTSVPLANLRDSSKALLSLAADDKISNDLRKSYAAKSIASVPGAKGEETKRILDSMNQSANAADNKQRESTGRMFSVNNSTLALPELDKDAAPILGFDLKVLHPKRGELHHDDEIRDLLTMVEKDTTPLIGEVDGFVAPEADDSKKEKVPSKVSKDAKGGDSDEEKLADDLDSSLVRRRGAAVIMEKDQRRRRKEDNDDSSSVSDSLVSGDFDRNGLRIDPFFYTGSGIVPRTVQQDERSRVSVESASTEDRVPKGDQHYHRRSHLAQRLLHAKFTPRRVDNMMNLADDVLSSRQLDRQVSQQDLYLARKTTVPMMRNDFFLRAISRGGKSRLNRYGIQDAMRDTALIPGENLPPQYQHLQMTHGGRGAVGQLVKKQGATDLELEARDELSVHEISLQFAGFRYGPPADSRDIGKSPAILSVPEALSNGTTSLAPRAVYFSYQFFTCAPTRTESMRLSPADKGQISVLIRDTVTGVRGGNYDEPALVLRYVIDCSRSSPFECVEFSDYLANKSLYIDVWDSDSLLPIGTFGIPMRMLMRQGALCVKHAIECDVINYETVAPVQGGITSLTIMEGGPISGELVGSVQMIISNYGIRGKGKHRPSGCPTVPIEGLNWRLHHDGAQMDGGRMIGNNEDMKLRRPKTSVMARPLSATAPDLSKALQDLRDSNGATGPPASYRSLLIQGRDHGGGMVSTLNYDEVVLLFRRFQGIKKGTVQYSGALLQLMDLPSSQIVHKKVIKLFKLYGDALAFRNALLQHANSAEHLKSEDIQECFRVMSDRCGLKLKPEERTLLAKKLLQSKGDQTISATEIMNYISTEADRQDWVLVSRRLRNCAQKAELDGYDVEQMLAEYDAEGKHHIPTRSFRDFLIALAKFGKLTQHDIHVCCRFFARHGRALDDRDPVSLSEVMAVFGKNYVGNLQARVRKIIQQGGGNAETAIEAKYVLRLLSNVSNEGALPGNAAPPGQYTYAQVEQAFRSLGVFTELSHPQVKYILSKMDVRGSGLISAAQVLTYLGIPYRASDLPSQRESTYDYDTNDGQPVIDTEYILKLLLQKAQSNGVQIDQAFRHFDTNGDGQISREELITGMEKLELFEGVPNWKQQIPGIVKKFDASGDGLVSLREFFTFLGIKDYAPNIIQRLTKIFSVATDKGLSIEAIFQELDTDKTGTIDAQELENGLKRLGTFENVTPADIASVIKQFDQNGDKKIAMSEFSTFFAQRVAQDKIVRKKMHALKIAKRFREVMRVAQSKGATLEMIFGHLDKDKGGSVSTSELADALCKMPNFKSISREDIEDLLAAIDIDSSGDVTLSEFEAFVNNADGSSGTSDVPRDIIQLIRETFGAAISKGLSIEKEFSLVDRDRSGKISLSEFESIVRKMPSFRDLPTSDIKRVFDAIDRDRSGMVSPEEFSEFVRTGQVSFERSKQRAADKSTREESKTGSTDERKSMDQESGDDSIKERFIRHMRRISDIDGSIRALLAYLDDDEDGLIEKRRLTNLLRREGVFQSIPEQDVDSILKPFERSRDRNTYDSKESEDRQMNRDSRELFIEVVPLLTFLEQRKYQPRMVGDMAEEDALLEKELTEDKEYTFSRDPEVCSVERKLRQFGRLLAKQGTDVEKEFQSFDLQNTGMIMRTEFVKVLGKLGMYLLEEGKVLRDQKQGDPDETIRQRQVQQIKQIKGADGMFVRQAPNLARKMFRYDEPHAPSSSEFRVHF